MAESFPGTKKVFCDFCDQPRIQVGELSCQHRMCANCFPLLSNKLEKCYLCVLATAEVNRSSMKIIKCSAKDENYSIPTEEKLFCPNNNCAFVGTMLEMVAHRVVCNRNDPSFTKRIKTSRSLDTALSAQRNALKSSRFLDLLKSVFDSAQNDSGRDLTADDVRALTLDAWDYAELSLRAEGMGSDDQPNESRASTSSVTTSGNADFTERMSGKLDSGNVLNIPAKIAPKFSVEISDFVELNRSPEGSEAFDSNRSTSEIGATESNCSNSASGSMEWDLCSEGRRLSSSTRRAEDSRERNPNLDVVEQGEEEDDGLSRASDHEEELRLNTSARSWETIDGGDANRDVSEAESDEPFELRERTDPHNAPRPRRGEPTFTWSGVLTFAVYALLAAWMLTDRTVQKPNHPKVNHPGETDGYITWRMDNVTDLVARAQFNKRDLRLSEFISVRNYEVRLGVGSTFSVDDNVVILWITAVVMKDDERPWPFEENMQLRLEHENPTLVQSYDFKSDQKGQWREHKRYERRSPMYRQMQVETTKRLKYMRFSNYLTYDEAVAKGFIKNDSISVGFKLLPWGTSS